MNIQEFLSNPKHLSNNKSDISKLDTVRPLVYQKLYDESEVADFVSWSLTTKAIQHTIELENGVIAEDILNQIVNDFINNPPQKFSDFLKSVPDPIKVDIDYRPFTDNMYWVDLKFIK